MIAGSVSITLVSVILGDSIPLSGTGNRDIRLTHESTTVFGFEFVQTTYRVGRGD